MEEGVGPDNQGVSLLRSVHRMHDDSHGWPCFFDAASDLHTIPHWHHTCVPSNAPCGR